MIAGDAGCCRMQSNVPDDVRWLVHEALPSMGHVEVLVFLARRQGEAYTADEMLRDVSMSADVLPAF